METEYLTARKTVCQDYRILLRAEAEIPIPKGYPRIRAFYETLTDTIMRWTVEREGERLREDYLAADRADRARYRTKNFLVRGELLPTEEGWFAIVCRAQLTGQESLSLLQVWNLFEQTLLPSKEIVSRFSTPEISKFFTNRDKKGKVGKKHLKKLK